MSNTITIEGRATADAELRVVPSTGKSVANFTVADDYGHKDRQTGEWIKDGVTFLRVEVWEYLADEVAEKVKKGTKVSVTGALRQREYEHNGEKRQAYEIKNVSQVAFPLNRFKPKAEQPGDGRYQRPSQKQDDPWGSAPAGDFGNSDSNIPF